MKTQSEFTRKQSIVCSNSTLLIDTEVKTFCMVEQICYFVTKYARFFFPNQQTKRDKGKQKKRGAVLVT